MIQMGTKLRVIDNSGAVIVECIKVLKNAKKAYIGDEIVVSVKKVLKGGRGVKLGEVMRAMVAQTKYPIRREDGSTVMFSQNGAFLLKSTGGLLGTKIKIIPGELKKRFPNLPTEGVL